MIHDPEKKLIVLLLPKTGSTTLTYIFSSLVFTTGVVQSIINAGSFSIPIGRRYTAHATYNDILKIFPNIHLDEYTVYSFYREPVARFMSAFKYFQQKMLTELTVRAQNGNAEEFKLIYKVLYNDEDITRDPESITIDDIISTVYKNILDAPILDLFRPQTFYLTDKVTLLNFDDFENNVKMLLDVFGRDSNILIPKHNDTNSADYLSDLTEEQVTKIKQIYARDYEFFKSHNITF